MKQKRYIYGIVGCLLISMMLGISSCDGLEDELFQKNSYIVHNGWQDYALEVAEDNTTILPIYFGVNGTSANDKAAFSLERGSGTPAIVRLYSPAKTRISSVKNKVQSKAAPSFNLA